MHGVLGVKRFRNYGCPAVATGRDGRKRFVVIHNWLWIVRVCVCVRGCVCVWGVCFEVVAASFLEHGMDGAVTRDELRPSGDCARVPMQRKSFTS